MIGRYGLVSLALLVVAPVGQQQPEPEQAHTITILGVGQIECSHFVDEAEKERVVLPASAIPETVVRTQYGMFIGWSEGFISSFNDTRPGTSVIGKNSSMNQRSRWLENYCQVHPLESFMLANESLVVALAKRTSR